MSCLKVSSHLLSVSLTLECVRIHLDQSLFLYFIFLPDYVLCKIPLNSSCDQASDLSQQVESCNLILQIKIIGKHFYFSSATFWFWNVKIWYLKLSIQVQTLKTVIQNYFKKICLINLKFLREHSWNFAKNAPWN